MVLQLITTHNRLQTRRQGTPNQPPTTARPKPLNAAAAAAAAAQDTRGRNLKAAIRFRMR